MGGWMDGWMDGWMGGWVDGWVDGWMDGWVRDLSFWFRVSLFPSPMQSAPPATEHLWRVVLPHPHPPNPHPQKHAARPQTPTFLLLTRASGATYAAVPQLLKGKVAHEMSSSTLGLGWVGVEVEVGLGFGFGVEGVIDLGCVHVGVPLVVVQFRGGFSGVICRSTPQDPNTREHQPTGSAQSRISWR